jgi:fructose/tagatose bisphosphate aldolase
VSKSSGFASASIDLTESASAGSAHLAADSLEFHHAPKHTSWLNMVEIEIGVLRGQCLGRRIGERERLVSEIKAWQHQRNASGAQVHWRFTTETA